ncbi:MAG: radical SAM family heme chaperone HemW [Oscillospiraceae bacterium]
MKSLGIYIHIPFCKTKCPYCDFYTVPYDPIVASAYVNKIIDFFKTTNCLAPYEIDTIYFGGGTPSLLEVDLLCDILTTINEVAQVSLNCEVTIETNPTNIQLHTLQKLRIGGFNRISFGVQSSNADHLKKLGRKHTTNDVVEAIALAREALFSNISIDLMLAIPHQNIEQLQDSIKFAIGLGIDHISAYLLKIEENTPYYRNNMQNHCADDDMQADMYLLLIDELKKAGYDQYEISSFCKDKKYSKHNLKYWNCESYLGIGTSAHSFFEGKRFYFPRDLQAFLHTDILFDLTIVDAIYENVPIDEYIMLKLRLNRGLDLSEVEVRYGLSSDILLKKATTLEKQQLVSIEKGCICLTGKGFLLSNRIINFFLDN